MKTHHWILIATGALLLIGWSKRDEFAKLSSGDITLKQGSVGDLVKKLQQKLLNAGGEPAIWIKEHGGIDGIFGPGTEAALEKATGKKEVNLKNASDLDFIEFVL